MNRADFWCRVIGWLQIAGGIGMGVLIIFLWEAGLRLFGVETIPGISFLVWVFAVIVAAPPFFSGLFAVLFANAVEASQSGQRGHDRILLRIFTVLAGLVSAGVIGFFGLTVPPVGLFSLLGLATALVGFMGPDWTADLFGPRDKPQ
jgi:hypothetical protein